MVGTEKLKERFPDLPIGQSCRESVKRVADENEQFAVLAIKIDDFERLLELHGENGITNLILDIATTIHSLSNETHTIWGRLNRDVFVSLHRSTDEEHALELAKKVQSMISESGPYTVSIGIAVYPFWPFEKTAVFANAEKALDHAAFFGPNTITPFDAVSLNISADKLYQYGDIDGAIQELEKARKVDPKNANVNNSLGVCYGVKGKFLQAIECFKTAIELDPEDVMAIYNAGLAYRRLDNREKALRYFIRAFELDPKNPDISYQTGELYQEKGDEEKALEFLNKALAIAPQNGKIFRSIGDCYLLKQMIPEAIDAYKNAVKKDPTDAQSLSTLGHLYGLINENLEIAIRFCVESISIEPGNGLYHYRLAKLYQKRGELEGALKEFQEANRLGFECEEKIKQTEEMIIRENR